MIHSRTAGTHNTILAILRNTITVIIIIIIIIITIEVMKKKLPRDMGGMMRRASLLCHFGDFSSHPPSIPNLQP